MKYFKTYLLLLGSLFLSLALVSCGGDEVDAEDEDTPGSAVNPIEKSIQVYVKADEHELTGFLPETLTDWRLTQTQLLAGYQPQLETPETWVFAYPSKAYGPQGSIFSEDPRLAFGFNGTGKKRTTTFTINGVNSSGQNINYKVNLIQHPETRSGKVLNLTLTNLMPVNHTFQVYSSDINFKQNPLELEFDNGLRVKPLRCTEQIATLRIDAAEPFQARMKVHVGGEVYDYGITRVYTYTDDSQYFSSGFQDDRLQRVDLGNARFQTYNHMTLYNVRTQLYDDKFEPCTARYFGTDGQELTDGTALFQVCKRLTADVYFGHVNGLHWDDTPASLCLASSYAFTDSEKTLHHSYDHCYPTIRYVLLRRSTGRIYELDDGGIKYNFSGARWVASDEQGDKFYVDDFDGETQVIGSFTVPKDEHSADDIIPITPLSNITKAPILYWKAVDGTIYLNREQIWENGDIRQITRPNAPSYVEYRESFSSKKILCQWTKHELIGTDSDGYGLYRTSLNVADALSAVCYIVEVWIDGHSTPVPRQYKIYPSLDQTLFVPFIYSDNKPDWKGYTMTTTSQIKTFDVSGQLMQEYQNRDLEEIEFPLPFVGNYTYYYNKGTGELFRQQLQPLGHLERVAEIPADKYYARLTEDGLIMGYSEVTTDKVWVLLVSNDGKSELRYFTPEPGAEIFYCIPL